jgi:class 3 adenylate cyclase
VEASNSDLFRTCLQSLDAGVAIADAQSWAILFENAHFFQWFGPGVEAEDQLAKRLLGLNEAKARARLEGGRPYEWEADVKVGARTLTLAASLKPLTLSGRACLLVECRNISKQRETEYMLDSYSKMAEKNTRELQKEKERVEKLLLNIMPRAVYEEMKNFGTTTPQRFDSASVLMLDFVGFTDMAISRDPSALIAELNDIFSAFDRIVELFGCDRLKTIGDAYVAVSGLPDANPDHANAIAKVALRMRRYLDRRNASHPTEWRCRIGVASGPVIGSLVGIQKYVYDIFGPAINLAARLESLCDPMQIRVCETTYNAIRNDFILAECGELEVKGFDRQHVFELTDERADRR